MRWIMRIAGALALAWIIYSVSPYVSVYRLATAVQTRDLADLKARVNVRAVRLSLAKQILTVYLSEMGEGSRSDSTTRQMAGALIEFADPLIAELLSPETLMDLMDDGWPQSVVPDGSPPPSTTGSVARAETKAVLGLGSPNFTWRDIIPLVDMRGFRKFYLTLPSSTGSIRFYFRLNAWAWRLHGIELPDALTKRLAENLARRHGRKPS